MTRNPASSNHTIHVTLPKVVGIADDAHAFVRRLRGEPGQYLCLKCGEGTNASAHKTVRAKAYTAVGVGLTGVCASCGGSCSKRAKRCKSCLNERIAAGWARQDAVASLRRSAT